MAEIYWLTRLDFIFLASFLVFLTCTLFIVGYIIFSDNNIGDAVSRIKWLVVTDILAILSMIFVPSTRDALLIYGLGSVKEYVESNDKVKELPDKAIEVLDKYLDNINKDVNKEKQ